MNKECKALAQEIRSCHLCAGHFDHPAKPIFQFSEAATILVAGQAPGRKAHESGIPFNDPSGDRLRNWMGISRDTFYNPDKLAILPMGFCYPGHGKSGDLPPRQECAQTWRQPILDTLPNIQLTLVIGRYAIDWHLKESKKHNVTETVRSWRDYSPEIIPLPHPSPRNNLWLRKNTWFERDVLPMLRSRVRNCLNSD